MKVRQERGRSISLSALSEQRRRSSVGEVRIPSPLLLRKKTLEGDFDVRFFEFLVSMGVEGEARERLAAMPMEQKRAWLELHQKSKRASGQLALSRAQQYAAQLAAGEGDEALLTALRVCVQTEPVEWMEEFAAAGGAAAVLSQLSAAEKQERGGPAEEMARQARLLQLLHVVAAMLLTKRGRQILLLDNKASVPILSLCQLINCSLQDTLQRLALCLDPRTVGPAARALLYDRLALLCNHEPQFFPAVAAALEYYAFAKRERARHLDLLRAVRDEPAPAVRTSALRLVNVLVSTPDDLDERLRTRRAFLALGLAGALQRAPPALAAHQPFAIETDIFFKGKLSSDMLEDERLFAVLLPDVAAGRRAADMARRAGFAEMDDMVDAFLRLIAGLQREVAQLRAQLALRALPETLEDTPEAPETAPPARPVQVMRPPARDAREEGAATRFDSAAVEMVSAMSVFLRRLEQAEAEEPAAEPEPEPPQSPAPAERPEPAAAGEAGPAAAERLLEELRQGRHAAARRAARAARRRELQKGKE